MTDVLIFTHPNLDQSLSQVGRFVIRVLVGQLTVFHAVMMQTAEGNKVVLISDSLAVNSTLITVI